MDLDPKEYLLFELRRLNDLEVSLSPDYIQAMDRPLYEAVLGHFSRWEEALAAVGLNYTEDLRTRLVPRGENSTVIYI